MFLERILTSASSGWMDGSGPDADIVLSSRIRLARNIEGIPFPHALKPEQAEIVLEKVRKVTESLNGYKNWGRFEMAYLKDVPPLGRQVLVEKHLISPQYASDPAGKALIIKDDESICIMANEEDHFRIQCLFSGMQMDQAWVVASSVDDVMESQVDFAFDSQKGYLTACPTNVGTGLRASVMMHLPALVMTNQAGKVLSTVNKLGMVVRGLYGEGTEATGNIFQLSNQITLGQSEEEIINNLKGISKQVIDQERQARESMGKRSPHQMADRIWRSYGILSNARIIDSEEAIKHWSQVRLGVDLGLIKHISRKTINELLVLTRPGFIQNISGREMEPFDRDVKRAQLIREALQAAAN